jgi:hypothetical protein
VETTEGPPRDHQDRRVHFTDVLAVVSVIVTVISIVVTLMTL